MTKFSMKPFDNGKQEDKQDDNQKPKRFKMCYVDNDTILYRAATFAQQDYIEVTHKASGRVKEFPNVTSFGVRGGKVLVVDPDKDTRTKDGKDIKWLGWTNYDREKKGLTPFTLEDFKVTQLSRLDPKFSTVEEAIKNSLDAIGFVIGDIKRAMDSEDYRLVIGAGKGNYRDKEAKTIGYKSSRGEKPIFFSEVREAFVDQYKSKIIETVYAEAEDTLGWVANIERAKKGDNFDNWSICIAYIDKDVDMVYAPSFNYDKIDSGWRYPTRLECAKCLVAQSISGDPTDTIEGIPTLTEEVTKTFGLRKSNGCGKATAEKLIADCTNEQEMWERACFAYKSYYGEDKVYEFKDVHGTNQKWIWKDYLQQTYILVKMQDYEGQVSDVFDYMDSIGVPYEKEDKENTENTEVDFSDNIRKLKEVLSCYKTLTKPKILERMDILVKAVDELDNKLSLLK